MPPESHRNGYLDPEFVETPELREDPTQRQALHEQLWLEAREQFKTALPTLASLLLYRFPWLISLRFVGGIGAKELAAAALATTLCNVTGMSLSVGLSSAMTTLTGQAKGDLQSKQQYVNNQETRSLLQNRMIPTYHYQSTSDKEKREDSGKLLAPLIFLYRGLFIQMVFILPIGCWWIHGIKDMLLYLGQGEELSIMTQDYLRILTPGLFSYSINWTLTAWLQAIEMADVPARAAAIGLVLHVPINLLFIHIFDWGYLGVAVATVLFQLIQPVLILIYMFLIPEGYQRVVKSTAAEGVGRTKLSFWPEAQVAVTSAKGIGRYLELAVPGMVTITEWWASEISVFLSGRLMPSPSLALGAMTIYQSLNSLCFNFSMAFSVAGAMRVGNLLGAGDARAAEFASKVSVILAGIVSGTLACTLYWTPHTFFPSLFAPTEADLILETSKTVTLLSLYVLADGIQCAFNGIIKGCGRQSITMLIVAISYWIVALPLGYYISFVKYKGYMCSNGRFCGVVGLVAGMTTGTWVHMLLLAVAVMGTTNWEGEVKKAKQRLEADTERERKLSLMEESNKLDMLSL